LTGCGDRENFAGGTTTSPNLPARQILLDIRYFYHYIGFEDEFVMVNIRIHKAVAGTFGFPTLANSGLSLGNFRSPLVSLVGIFVFRRRQ
jgi:hypothetical protein